MKVSSGHTQIVSFVVCATTGSHPSFRKCHLSCREHPSTQALALVGGKKSSPATASSAPSGRNTGWHSRLGRQKIDLVLVTATRQHRNQVSTETWFHSSIAW